MTEEGIWIAGRRPVLEALRAGTATRVALAPSTRQSAVLDEIVELANWRSIHVEQCSLQALEDRTGTRRTQGVAAHILRPPVKGLSGLLSGAAGSGREPFLLALDQVQDPHNLGALIRTAEAAGVHGVVLPDRRSAPLSAATARASAGAVSFLPVLRVNNLARALDEIREAGVWVGGVDAAAPQSVYSADLTVPICLVVGNEGTGLRRLTRQHCDYLVRLPMVGHVESLNASVAGAIALYEVVRQRGIAAADKTPGVR